jgi:precorrin-3B synthase
METGDGLLVRFVINAPIPLDAFVGLCAAARAHGNGTMEVSARGSLQVRGLTPLSAPLFAAAVGALDIDISDGLPVLADPLPDDPTALVDANRLAAELRRKIAEAGLMLAPKVSVVVDGGGRVDLDAVAADIRLRGIATGEGPRVELALAGDAVSAVPVATIAGEDAIGEVLMLLRAVASRAERTPRAADLP